MAPTTRGHAPATTRATASIHVPAAGAGQQLLAPTQVIFSPETKLQYRIERMLGAGGFGQAYLATRRGRSATMPETGLHQGQRAHRRLAARGLFRPAAGRASARGPRLRPLPADARRRAGALLPRPRVRAVTATSARTCSGGGKRWTEAAARREIAGILEVLGKLHRGQLLHRDLTPMNVFVCDGRKLKLGDFGIVRQQSERPRRHRAAP